MENDGLDDLGRLAKSIRDKKANEQAERDKQAQRDAVIQKSIADRKKVIWEGVIRDVILLVENQLGKPSCKWADGFDKSSHIKIDDKTFELIFKFQNEQVIYLLQGQQAKHFMAAELPAIQVSTTVYEQLKKDIIAGYNRL